MGRTIRPGTLNGWDAQVGFDSFLGRRPRDRVSHDQRPQRDGFGETLLSEGLPRAPLPDPADGFYEWQRTDNGKQPYYVRMKNGSPFAFAGLWEIWRRDPGPEIRSCTIFTTEANELVGEVHHRMPVILAPEDHGLWLASDVQEMDPLLPLLAPYPVDAMEAYPVSRFVNSPSNEEPACVEPVS